MIKFRTELKSALTFLIEGHLGGHITWLNRCQRLAKDWEVSIASSEAWMLISSIRRMTRRIAKLEL